MRRYDEVTRSGGYASTKKEATGNGWEDNELGGEYDGCGDQAWWVLREGDSRKETAIGRREAALPEDGLVGKEKEEKKRKR
jgi:hypothetical protein